MLKFKARYFIFAVIIFFIELWIALSINDEFIRPHVGDFLVVILIYCFLKSFLNISAWKTGLFVLLFSFIVEILQYYKIVEQLGLQNSKVARVIIGTTFSWADILAYTLGIGSVLLIENIFTGKAQFKSTA